MTTPYLSPPVFSWPAAPGGKLHTYLAGGTTPQVTYSDAAGVTPNANPVTLDSLGSAVVRLAVGVAYHFVLKDSTDVTTIWDADNFDNNYLSTGAGVGAVLYPQTTAELAAAVTPSNYTYPPYDIRRYGGDSTGVAASDTALVAALAVCGTPGGTIRFPNGTYKFANQYSLSNRHGIVFQGDGGPTSASTNGTILTYSGTASPWFNMPQAQGILFKNMTLAHSNASFTGTYLKYGANAGSPAAFCGLDDVTMGSSVSNTTLIDLDATICFSAQRCIFQFGNPTVKGQASAGGSFSNVVDFHDCQFTGHPGMPVVYGGESWSFDGCDFEGLSTAACGAFSTVSTAPCLNMSFRGCWLGDATTGGTWITFYGKGLAIHGNRIGGNATATMLSLNACSGISVQGNWIAAFLSVIDFTTAPISAVALRDNSLIGNVALFTTTANAPGNFVYNPNFCDNLPSPVPPPSQVGVNGASGWKTDPDGRIEQWGTSSVVTGTPLAVVFTKAFPTAAWNAICSLVTPVSGANTCWVTGLSTTGMTLNVNGTAGTSPVHWRVLGI